MPLETPISLEHPIRPDSSYAISKTGGEQYIQLSGIPLRLAAAGQRLRPAQPERPASHLLQRLSEGKPCFVVDTRRDFVYVDDLLEVVIAALNGTGDGVYHVSSGSDYSIKELFDAVVEAMGIELDEEVEVRPRPEEDAPSILLDPSRTREGLRLEGRGPARERRRRRDRVVPRQRGRRDVHPPDRPRS